MDYVFDRKALGSDESDDLLNRLDDMMLSVSSLGNKVRCTLDGMKPGEPEIHGLLIGARERLSDPTRRPKFDPVARPPSCATRKKCLYLLS